jgi:hypothetical protein
MRRFIIGSQGAKQIISDLAIDKNTTAVEEAVRNSVTVRSLGERFIAEYISHHLKFSSPGEYQRCIVIFINPETGAMKLLSVERKDAPKDQCSAPVSFIAQKLQEFGQILQAAQHREYAPPQLSLRGDCLVQGVTMIQRVQPV